MYPPSIQKLIEQFSKFPTVGPRTAARFVFYLLKISKSEAENILESISQLREKVKLCSFCFNAFEGDEELCDICRNPRRDTASLCVVEKEPDLEAIEKTGQYKGRYFVLGGTVSRLRKEDLEKLRTKELSERAKKAEIKEIILATNSTPEGENTALYLERLLAPAKKKTTRLGRGIPVGGELEYADAETLKSALEGRR
jgi:recombination protein RecR